MPPNFFQKPETALKRAQELILVGKEADALDTLHDTIKARRHKHQWSQTHEAIMLKHVELCVSLRKPHVAKDALFQYKALTQQIAVKSLEVVIQHFLELAEQRTNEAQKTSIEKVEEIDDLDQADAPENLLLSAVSGAATQDRMDRTVLSPWLRFLWDSYRNCLELLRNNSQVEQLYHRIAKQSFAFCARYQRRTEFRKLCDILRQHLNQIQKHQHLNHVVKLSSAESLTLMQETRLCQLDTAIQMELWQEAYRSAEDVHGMMQLSKDKDKRMVKPASSVNYYDKLALVFWKAGNRLFHAAALLQKFIIYKDMKKSFTEEEARDQASRVLLATLSIPEGADQASDLTRHLDIEDQHFANIRLLSNLLRLPIAPTRSGILKEAARLNVPDVAAEPVRQVFRLLEKNFAPLRLASQVNNQLSVIEESLPDYAQYVDALRSVVATKTLKQVSLIYDTISWSRIRKVIPFFEDIELERFLVDVSKHRFVKAQLDHRAGVVRFGSSDATLAGGGDLEDADGFTGDDAQFGEQGLRTHLQLVYNKLKATVNILDAEKKHKADLSRVEKHANIYETHKNQDYERILLRRRKIETYKETSERVKAEKSQAALAEQQRREEARRAEEMKRLEQENQDIEKKRKIAAQKEVEEKVRIDQLNKLRQTAIYKVIVQERGEDVFQNMDPESVLREQRQRLDEERREQQARLQQQEKKFDHGVRAFHLEEMLERRVISERRHKEAPKLHEEFEKRRVETAIAEHEAQKQIYNNLEKIREDAINWIASVKESHKDEFAQRTEEWRAKLLAVKQSRLAERAEERRRKRREEWIKKKAEEERLRKEDEDRARQAQHEEQKRAGKERVRDSLRQMQDDESKAMQDSNWRSGPRSAPPPSASRPTTEQYKAILREIPAASSQADQDTSWRKGAQPVGPAPGSSDARQSQAYRPRPLQESEAPTRADFGTRRVERVERPPLPASNTPAESGGRWERGQVQRRTDEQPARRVDEPPKETPTDDGKPKPWRPRRELGGESGAPARNEPLPRGDRDGREAPHRDGREAPQQRDIRDRDRDRDRRGPMPARGKADTDTNWRR